MDDLRFRKIFNLGITEDGYFRKEVIKIRKNCQKVWLRNVVKYGKYSPAKLANLYTFVLRAEIHARNTKVYKFAKLEGYMFCIL